MVHGQKPDFTLRWGGGVQSTTGGRAVHISLQGLYCSCKPVFCSHVTLTGYPLHSLVSPSLLLPCVTVCHHISNAVYVLWLMKCCSLRGWFLAQLFLSSIPSRLLDSPPIHVRYFKFAFTNTADKTRTEDIYCWNTHSANANTKHNIHLNNTAKQKTAGRACVRSVCST